jgi:peroxiredoxin
MLRIKPLILAVVGVTCLSASAAGWKSGDALPDLSTFGLEGKLPDNLKGKVVVLDFWASWCVQCKESFPALERLHEKYGNQGLVVVGVTVDEKAADVEKFLKKTPVKFSIARDAKQKLATAADVDELPATYFIDRSGKIRYAHTGFDGKQTEKKYQEEIKKLLDEKGP